MIGDLGVALLELHEVLLELLVAEQRVLVVRRVVDDPAPELRGGGTDAETQNQQRIARIFLFIELLSFLSCLLEIGRHFVVVVVGQREIAREIDFDAVAFPDGDRGHDVEELVEDLRGRLRGALRKSLAHEVAAVGIERASGASFAHGAESPDGKRDPEDAEIVVVDLIAQSGVADLVEPLELIEADGVSVRHEQAMKDDGQTCLAEGVHLLGFAEQASSLPE